MRDLVFIHCVPDDDYFVWQTQLWLESLREIRKSEKAVSLILTPYTRKKNSNWDSIISLYPEAEFFFLEGESMLNRAISLYIPILRPYLLNKYFQLHPELTEKAIFYCDADVLFTKNFNIDKYLDDDICYLSNTNSYINATYFDSKVKDVLPEKLDEYKKRDILEETTNLVGINRKIASNFNEHSGGAQYLLKNIGASFWEKVMKDCLLIRGHLLEVNRTFFANESKGFQSWCADMFSVLWNLWLLEKDTKVVPEMDFAWSSDPISKLDKVGIFHNAGIVTRDHGGIPVFYKGEYHQGKSPFNDPYVEELYNNDKNKTLCNSYYVERILNIKNKYHINN